jgi:DNA-binding winged helix-turn-helix (wHTH) protein/tetratricopeptide (TPR) repeat protein
MSMKNKDIMIFGEFRIDVLARSLRRNSAVIPLNRRAFDVLLYFARNPGKVLSKEELLRGVWPDAFVETNSLTQSISVLRKALGDLPDGDGLIVTLPGRGYQFTARVFVAPAEPSPLVEAAIVVEPNAQPGLQEESGSGMDLLVEERTIRTSMVTEETEYHALPAPKSRRKLALPVALGVAALILLCVWMWRRTLPITGPVSLVLADLENATGEPKFDHALNQALQIDLEQSPYLHIVPKTIVQETLVEMQRGKSEPLTPSLAQEVCERTNALVVLNGSISKFGEKYLILLHADSCVTGKTVAGYKADANSEEDVLNALDQAANRMRKQLGESNASLGRYQIPIAQATTSSLDALRAYSEAEESFRRGDMKSAQTLLYRAIGFDPNFASAYRVLGSSYYNLNDYKKAAEFFKRSFDLRDHTTERERFSIETMYFGYSLNDLEEAIRRSRQFGLIYPDVAENWVTLCSLSTQLGRYSQAVEAGEHALSLDPHSGVASVELARAYLHASRFADAKRIAEAAVADGKDHWDIHSILFQIAFWENDAARMKSEGEWGLSHQHGNTSLYDLGMASIARGRLQDAMDDFSRARTDSLSYGEVEFANEVLLDSTSVLIDIGERTKAAENLKTIRGDMGDPGDVEFLKASFGESSAGKQFLGSRSVNPHDTVEAFVNIPILRAVIALNEHKPADAVQLLEPARPYQLRDYSVPYWRARAETEAGMLEAAAADYQLILDNPGVNPISPEYPLAHLYLARILVLQKKIDPARVEYRKFLEAWKYADRDISLLQEAKRQFNSLP